MDSDRAWIGRPQVEPSFLASVIDRWCGCPTPPRSRPCALPPTAETGSVVTLVCDRGDRYAGTAYDDGWLAGQDLDIRPWTAHLDRFLATGVWDPPPASAAPAPALGHLAAARGPGH